MVCQDLESYYVWHNVDKAITQVNLVTIIVNNWHIYKLILKNVHCSVILRSSLPKTPRHTPQRGEHETTAPHVCSPQRGEPWALQKLQPRFLGKAQSSVIIHQYSHWACHEVLRCSVFRLMHCPSVPPRSGSWKNLRGDNFSDND